MGTRAGRHAHREQHGAATRSRRSRRSPAATAPTSSSTPSAARRPGSRRSTPATWPARSCWSACRRPDMRIPDIPLIDVFGRGGALKSSWYGDCLPTPGLPDARRPLPAGPARPRRVRHRGDRHRRRRGGVREDAPRRRAALAWSSSDDGAARRPRRHSAARSRLDGETFDVDNNVWVVGDDDECVVIDAPHSVDGILAVVGDRTGQGDRLHPRPRRPRAASRRRCARRPARRSCCTPTTGRCGSSPTRDRPVGRRPRRRPGVAGRRARR